MYKRAISMLLTISMVLSVLSGCTTKPAEVDNPIENPNVNVTIVDKPTSSNTPEIVADSTSDVESLVCSYVSHDLQSRGYVTTDCLAFSSDDTYQAVGIGYYNPELEFFADDEYEAHGFVSIIGPEDDYKAMPTECEYIAVEPIDGNFDNEALYNIVAYTCDTIEYNHFVYENQYVIYYQLDSTTVRYETYENKRENYDLSLGSLYDFDNDVFIYDASLFDGYETHSGVELFSEKDYAALEAELKAVSEAQEKNGYYVEELNVVYISPESIQAYLASEEEDTFFGYSVAELESSIGMGSALVFTEDGFEVAEYFEENPEEYNWNSFLTKVGIGTGIILVGAILTPITGGASFGCALVTISTITISASLVEGVGTLAIETASGMIQGKSFEDALRDAVPSGLDAFANTFLITAAITTVGVTSGVIKPIACFVAGTMVAIPTHDGVSYKLIEDITVGDMVYSYDEITDSIGINVVTEIFENSTDVLVSIKVAGEEIISTMNHPYYNPTTGCWVEAGSLSVGDEVLLLDGSTATVDAIAVSFCNDTPVYNFSVEHHHTYFVGAGSVLVHNKCNVLQAKKTEGIQKAWKKELDDVVNGKSRYNWTEDEIAELLQRSADGKKLGIKGYDGCHIKDAHLFPELANNPDNIIFLKHDVHINVVHGGKTQNASRWGEIIKVMPQFKEQVLAIGGLL